MLTCIHVALCVEVIPMEVTLHVELVDCSQSTVAKLRNYKLDNYIASLHTVFILYLIQFILYLTIFCGTTYFLYFYSGYLKLRWFNLDYQLLYISQFSMIMCLMIFYTN